MPGPVKTPTAVLAKRGSWLAKTRDGEPEYRAEMPECPAWAGKRAREHWDLIAPQLFEAGILKKAHGAALGLFVNALAEYVHAAEAVDNLGYTISDGEGEKTNPAIGARDRAWERALKAAIQFGLTPSAQASVKVLDKKKDKSKERFFDTA